MATKRNTGKAERPSNFPLPIASTDQHIADVGALADRDFKKFGWNERKPTAKEGAGS